MGAWPWRPPLPQGWAKPSLPCQRYLDEAEREKQQYMKELRAYQQSEAYKMCTEKIQEKKIKKGEKGPSLQAAECLLGEGQPWRLTHPPPWGYHGGRGRRMFQAGGTAHSKQSRVRGTLGRLTLPSSLPHQRTRAPGS